MDLNELTEANKRRNQEAKAFARCKDWTLSDWSTAIAGETGEMCNLMKKMRWGDDVDVQAVGKELASCLHLNLSQKFNEVSGRVGSNIKLR